VSGAVRPAHPAQSAAALFYYVMPSLRLQRVRELLKRSIGEAIRREFPVQESGLVTVNDVDVSGDLHSAVVFISILGSSEQQKRGLTLLTHHRKRIQGLVARDVVLKYTPVLKFIIDDSVVRGNRVLAIIEELDKTNPPDKE
jgi:ribosome-binding factor A